MRRKDDLMRTGSWLGLFIGQIIIVILCVAYMDFIYNTNIYPDKQVEDNFDQTTCYVTSKRLSIKGTILHSYRADFLVNYKAPTGPTQYSHWVSGNGLDLSFTQNRSSQENLLDQFEIGSVYPCYYNPQDPQVTVLVLRHSWTSTLPLLVPAAIIAVMGYYILKTLLQWMGTARVKTRDAIRKKKDKRSQQTKQKK